jgi:hypothetical protein
VRQVGVLATCGYPARRPASVDDQLGITPGHRQILLATFSRPKPAFLQLMSTFQATHRRNLGLDAPDVLSALPDASARPVTFGPGHLAGAKLTIEVPATAEEHGPMPQLISAATMPAGPPQPAVPRPVPGAARPARSSAPLRRPATCHAPDLPRSRRPAASPGPLMRRAYRPGVRRPCAHGRDRPAARPLSDADRPPSQRKMMARWRAG